MEDSKKAAEILCGKYWSALQLLVFLVSGGLTLRSYLADKKSPGRV